MHNEKTLKDLSLAEELIHKAELCLESNFELANERYSIAHKIIYNKEDTLNKTYGSSQIQSMKNDIDLISDGTYLEYKMSDFVLEDISREGFLDNVTSILKNTKDKIIEFIKRIINYIKNLFRSEKTKSKEVKLKKANKEEINNVVINIKSANINKVPDISKHPVNRVNEDNYIPENKTKTNIIQEISKTQSPEIFLINLIKLIKVNSLFNIMSTVDLTKEDRDHIKLHSEWDDDYKKNLNNIPKSLEEFLKNLKNKCNLTDAVSEIKEAIKQKIIIPEYGIKSIKVISSFVNQIYDVINSEVNKNELEKLQNEITEKQIENIKDILVYGLKDINKISDDVSNLIYDTIQLVNKEFKDEDGFAEQSNAFLNVLFAFTKMNGLAFSKFDILTRAYVDLLELNINIDKDILEKEMFEANMKMFEHDYELVCEAFNLEDNIRRDLENLNENNKEEINARYYVYNHKINGNMTCERLTTEQLKVSLEGFMDTLKTVGSKIVEVIKKLIEYIIKGFRYLISLLSNDKELYEFDLRENIDKIESIGINTIATEARNVGVEITVTKTEQVINSDLKGFISNYKNYKKNIVASYISLVFYHSIITRTINIDDITYYVKDESNDKNERYSYLKEVIEKDLSRYFIIRKFTRTTDNLFPGLVNYLMANGATFDSEIINNTKLLEADLKYNTKPNNELLDFTEAYSGSYNEFLFGVNGNNIRGSNKIDGLTNGINLAVDLRTIASEIRSIDNKYLFDRFYHIDTEKKMYDILNSISIRNLSQELKKIHSFYLRLLGSHIEFKVKARDFYKKAHKFYRSLSTLPRSMGPHTPTIIKG